MTPRRRRRADPGLRFALPWFVGLFALTALPMIASLLLSFTRWDGLSLHSVEWVGAQHYRDMLAVDRTAAPQPTDPDWYKTIGGRPRDERFWQALYNSFAYSVWAVPLGLVVSLALALLLNQRLRGMALFRTLFYLPYVLCGVATILVWQWALNPEFGVVNYVLRELYALIDPFVRIFVAGGTSGWKLPAWLYSPQYARPALVLMHVWTVGGATLIFLAALQSVPPQLRDAARVDGATAWRRFRCITLPHLTPAVLFNGVTGFLASMQVFNQAYLLRHWSQQDTLLFYVLHLYRSAFEEDRFGYACALAWVLFAILFVLSAAAVWLSRRWVYYASRE